MVMLRRVMTPTTPPMRPRTATARPPATPPTTEKSRQRKQPRISLYTTGVSGEQNGRAGSSVPDSDEEGQDQSEGGAGGDVQDNTESTEDEL